VTTTRCGVVVERVRVGGGWWGQGEATIVLSLLLIGLILAAIWE
jgi:hypothetical protein